MTKAGKHVESESSITLNMNAILSVCNLHLNLKRKKQQIQQKTHEQKKQYI
jgi:hypothetical protein